MPETKKTLCPLLPNDSDCKSHCHFFIDNQCVIISLAQRLETFEALLACNIDPDTYDNFWRNKAN